MIARPQWRWFALWAVVGGAYAMTVLGAFTIGLFFVPVAIGGTVGLARARASRASWPGAIAGLGLPALLVAWLNRAFPSPDTIDPKPWLAGAVAFVVVSAVIFLALQRAYDKQRSLQ
jgi:hypothetical protein